MAKKQNKARQKQRRRGAGVGSYLLTMVVSAVVTAVLIAVLVVATSPLRGGVSAAGVSQASTDTVPTSTVAITATPARTGVVAASSDSVNVRSGPGTDFEVLSTVNSGATVVILGQNGDGTWQNIQLDDGRQGWISTALLRLPQEPTAVAQATEVVEVATELVVVECQGNEAGTWWSDSASALFTQSKYAVLRAEDNQFQNINDLYISVETDQTAFEGADYPPCVTTLRASLLQGSQEILDGLQDYANGNQEAGRRRIANAQTTFFEPVEQTVSTDLGVEVFAGDCPVDAWMAGIEEPYARFTTIINEFAPGSTAIETIRPLIFETQRLRQTVAEAFTPDCANTVRDFLLDFMDEGIGLLQGAFAGDQTAVQSRQAGLVRARDVFRSEITRLGYAL
jgi:uncharacterized protein YraI